jgi:ammonia channel protein AmtB
VDANAIGGLLLPAGLWLLIAAGVPSQHHHRLAAAALIALAIGTLTLVAWGFAFAFGSRWQALSLESDGARWVFLGLHGFFLQDATDPESIGLLVRLWPLVAAGALLAAGAVPSHVRLAAVALFALLVCGLILPVIACWGWTDGWLARLGENADLGRGWVDVGRLSTIGLATGMASLIWARLASPREPTPDMPQLPATQFPVRAVAGVLLSMAGAAALGGYDTPALSSGQFVSGAVAVSAAILTAGLYTTFTTRHADVLSAGRAALASVFVTSSAGALLPLPVVVGLGMVCGLLATIGYYVVHERWGWNDEAAIVTSVLAPSAIGLVCTGVFANGSYGVVGLLSRAELPTDQLLAQVLGIFAIALFAYSVSRVALWPLRVAPNPAARTVRTSAEPASVLSEVVATPEPAAMPTAEPAAAQDAPVASAQSTVNTAPKQTRRGLFERFKRSNVAAPTPPKQPRKVAYPYRVGGRPLSARPLAAEDGSASSETTSSHEA